MKVWKFLLLLAGLGALGLMVLVLVHFVVLPRTVHRHDVVVMPDLRGSTVPAARLRVEPDALDLEETRQRPHPSLPAGTILEQLPAPGSPVRAGRTVRVVTSAGPPGGGVPDLTGLSERQAEITLQRESYRVGRVTSWRQEDLAGPTVLFQNPPAGRYLRKGMAIDLVVGEPAPPRLLRMPDLRGVPLYLARQQVTAAGCVLAPITYERAPDQAPGEVIAQSPPPGRRIRKGDRIELVASSP